jgi:ankyrin repeat protein
MSVANKQDALKKYQKATYIVIKENEQAFDALENNNISMMEKIFKTGGIEQEAIDHLIFQVRSVETMKLFLRYGGDIHKPGPPMYPNLRILLLNCTGSLLNHAVDSTKRRDMVKLIEFLIEEGVDVNAADDEGFAPFLNCAMSGDVLLCKFLVERGANPSAKQVNGSTTLHDTARSGGGNIFRYLVEDCELDIDAIYQAEDRLPRTPLCIACKWEY